MMYGVCNVSYTIRNNKPVVYIFARDENGNRKVFTDSTFRPYFYVPLDEANGEIFKAFHGEKVRRVYTKLPFDVPAKREMYSRTWEADIPYPMRYLIDKGVKHLFNIVDGKIVPIDKENEVSWKVLYLDIESEVDDGLFPDEMIAKTRILSITFGYDENNLTTLHINKDGTGETEMLEEFFSFVEETDPDVFAGWNVQYDINYIINRAYRLNLKPERLSPLGKVHPSKRFPHIAGRSVFDCLQAFKRYHHGKKFETYSLDFLAAHPEVGVGFPEPRFDYAKKMNPSYIDEVARYNKQDVVKMCLLVKKWNLVNHYQTLAKFVGCDIMDSLVTTRYLDVLFLRHCKNKVVLPTRNVGGRTGEAGYEGAFVKKTTPGILNFVISLDFSAMYPSIIIRYNLSPETLSDSGVKIGNNFWKKEPLGILPQILIELANYRQKYKAKYKDETLSLEERKWWFIKQYSVKQIIAAIYGNLAYPGNRLYTPQISETTCYIGRKYVNNLIETASSKGFSVAIADTDSAYIYKPGGNVSLEKAIRIGREIEGEINNSLKEDTLKEGYSNPPEIEMEKIYEVFLSTSAKKKYAGKVVWESGKILEKPYIDVKGFALKKSSSALITRNMQKRMLEMLLLEGKGVDDVREYFVNIWNNIDKKPLEEIGIPLNMSMMPSGYKKPAAVKGVLYANKYLKKRFGPGSRMLKFYIKNMPPDLPQTIELSNGKVYKADWIVLNPAEDNLDKWRDYIDWSVTREKLLLKKIERLIEPLGYTVKEFIDGQRQTKLFDFGERA